MHTSNGNQKIALLFKPQQKAPGLRPSGLDVVVVATKNSQDVST